MNRRQLQVVRKLAESDRAAALVGDPLHFRGRELHVPQRNEAERNVHATRRLTPLLDHPVVVRLHAREPELLVVGLVERLAAEAWERGEGERTVGPVELEVLD